MMEGATDEQKGQFWDAMLKMQFTGEVCPPKDPISKMAFNASLFQLKKQLDGFETATSTPIQEPPQAPPQGSTQEPPDQRIKNKDKGIKNKEVSTIDKIEINVKNGDLKKSLSEFMEHRKSKRAPIKSQMQFDKMLKQLRKLSGDNPIKAIEIIDQSIANGWNGIFELAQSSKNGSAAPGRKSLDDCDRELLEGITNGQQRLIE